MYKVRDSGKYKALRSHQKYWSDTRPGPPRISMATANYNTPFHCLSSYWKIWRSFLQRNVRLSLHMCPKCVSKNVTPRRMLIKCFLIAKINRWNNTLQNMYDYRRKLTIWPGKLILSKKHLKTAFLGGHDSGDPGGVSWLWQELYAKLLAVDHFFGYPWKLLGYNGSN